jgi:hypothetical protein
LIEKSDEAVEGVKKAQIIIDLEPKRKQPGTFFFSDFLFITKNQSIESPLPTCGERVRVRGKDIFYKRKYFLF